MSDALLGLPAGFTNEEVNFVYNAEVLGLPTRKAAALAGLDYRQTNAPHLLQARETTRNEMRGNLQVTKEDVTHGLKTAIDQARILADPMAQIAGWGALTKLHGLDAPSRVDINLNASVEVLTTQFRRMSDEDLVKSLGAGHVIDAEFYVANEKNSNR